MNKLFRATILLITVILCSCSKGELPGHTEEVVEKDYYDYEGIYKLTGCKVENAGTISKLNPPFTDSAGYLYLYGARKSGTGRVFWISKYTSKGDLVWETNKAPNNELYTRALWPKELSNGDIVIACIVDKGEESFDGSKTMLPTIASKDNGIATFVKVLNNYFYSYVNVYDGFFICGIDDKELSLNVDAINWGSKISNSGDILLSIPKMRYTNEATIFLSNDEMITAESKYIERAFLDGTKSPKWRKDISLPAYKSYKYKSSLASNLLSVTYNLILPNNEEKEVNYKLDVRTGEDYISVTGIELDKKELVLAINKIYNLKATITPSDASDAEIEWKSSNEKVATVNEVGLVTGVSEGDCEISASINGTNIESKCKIKVSTIKVTGISLNESSIGIKTGAKSELTAKIHPADAYSDIIWSSSDNLIATVDNGAISAINEGICVITAATADGLFSASCTVSVTDPIITDMIKLYFPSSSIINIGGFLSGTIYSAIVNKSKKSITLTSFEVRESNTNRLVVYEDDQSKLGILQAGGEQNLGGLLNSVYKPKFIWFFTFEGEKYRVSHSYN